MRARGRSELKKSGMPSWSPLCNERFASPEFVPPQSTGRPPTTTSRISFGGIVMVVAPFHIKKRSAFLIEKDMRCSAPDE